MTSSFRLFDVPGFGASYRIPIVDHQNPSFHDPSCNGVKSPEWMIHMDDLLESTVDGYLKHAELFGWSAESSRYTGGDIANNYITSASLRHSDLYVLIPYAGYAAKLEVKMNKGEKIDALTIVRLANIGALKIVLQKIIYTTCRIQSFQQILDRLCLRLSVQTRENTIFQRNQLGLPIGQSTSKVDYSKATAELA